MTKFRYRPDIDGLRAVAVLLVVFFHANLCFPGGYVGVDVFFVISGYLITGLILKEQSANKFSLANFWVRRIRRIIPAASVLTAATLIAGCVLLLPGDLVELAESAISQQLMLSNIYFWKSTSYFDGPAETKALLHTWSLAVEEQFYLGFPFLLILCHKLSKKIAFTTLLGLAIVSFGMSEWGVRRYPMATFFLLPTRMWELLLGSLLAHCPGASNWKKPRLECCSWIGFVCILAAGWSYDSHTLFPGTTALLPCMGTGLVIFANTTYSTSLGLILSNKYLVFLGLISYSLYLWHWPIFAFLHYWLGQELKLWIRLVAITASLIFAYGSWRFIETPFRRGISPVGTQKTVLSAIAASAFLVCFSVWVNHSNGLPERLPCEAQKILETFEEHQYSAWNVHLIEGGKLPIVGAERNGSEPVDFIVWGDSHAEALGDMFNSLGKEFGLSGVIAVRHATVPLLGVGQFPNAKSIAWNDAVLQYIRDNKVSNVILVAKWASYIENLPNGRSGTLISEKQSRSNNSEEAKAAFRNGHMRTLIELQSLGAKTWILGQVPLQNFNPKLEIVSAEIFGKALPHGVSLAVHQEMQINVNSIIDTITKDLASVNVLDPAKYCFNELGHSKIWGDRGVYYTDDNHLSRLGANRLLRPVFESVFRELSDESANSGIEFSSNEE